VWNSSFALALTILKEEQADLTGENKLQRWEKRVSLNLNGFSFNNIGGARQTA
jgi:hypothetical protein